MSVDIEKVRFSKKDIDKKLVHGSDRMKNIFNMARNMEYQQYFEPGQVLVLRQVKDSYNTKAGSLVLSESGAPQKFIVADKLDGNLVLCRKLGVSGRPGKSIHVIADTDFDTHRFEEDPEIADAILLDSEYNPMHLPKLMGKARRLMKTHNNKIHINAVMKEMTGNSSYEKVLGFLEELVQKQGGCVMWSLENDTKRKMMHIVSIDKAQNQVTFNDGSVKRNYDLTSRYGEQYYLEEPLTRDDALQRIKSK
jgi:hypothetical protein